MKKLIVILMSLCFVFSSVLLMAQGRYSETAEEEFTAALDRPLEVILQVDAGEVLVEKGSDERSGSVMIRYAPRKFRQKIDFDERTNRLRISFDMKGLKSVDTDEESAEVYVRLPYGVDIVFEAKVKAGEVTMEMGGLRLTDFYLNNWAGEVEVRFDEPNPVVMEMLDVTAKVGESSFVRLGNARFKKANINGGIGELDVDFTGDLVNESRARVDLDIGEASIYLPRDVGIKMRIGGGFSFLSEKHIDRSLHRRGGSYYSDDYEGMQERFYVSITPGLGELTVERE